MARGRAQHEAQQAALAALGKDLSRRSGSICELCAGRDAPKPTLVLPDQANDPGLDDAILACAPCRALLDGGRLPLTPTDRDLTSLRFLATSIWSEVGPVQIASVRLLRRLVAEGITWAEEANDGLWLDDAVEAQVGIP